MLKEKKEFSTKFTMMPGWVSKTMVTSLSLQEWRLLTVILRHTSMKDRKSHCWVETLSRETEMHRRNVGQAKMKLARKGIIAFSRDRREGGGHIIWVAWNGPYKFSAKIDAPDFREYRRLMASARPRGTRKNGLKRVVGTQPKVVGFQPQNGIGQLRVDSFATACESIRSQVPPQTCVENSSGKIGFGPPPTGSNRTGSIEPSLRSGCAHEAHEVASLPVTATAPGRNEVEEKVRQSSMLDLNDFEESSPQDERTAQGLPQEPPAPPKRPKAHPAPQKASGGAIPASALADSKRVGKKLEDREGPHFLLLDHHCKNFERTQGIKSMPDFGKDLKLAKQMLAVYDLDTLKTLSDFFFKSPDKFIKQSGYTMGVFRSQLSKLIVLAKKAGAIKTRSQYAGPQRVKGQRLLMVDTATETVYDEWDGTKWVEVRIKKSKPVVPSRPAVNLDVEEFEDEF